MRVVYVVDDISKSAGGVPEIAFQTAKAMQDSGASVEVVGLGDAGERRGSNVLVRSAQGGGFWGFSRELVQSLRTALAAGTRGSQVVHIHGIWKAPQVIAARMASRRGIPTIISEYGILDPWFWKYRGWLHAARKRLFWRLVCVPAYRCVALVHSPTPRQVSVLRNLFPGKPILTLPPGVDLGNAEFKSGLSPLAEEPRELLFVGRLDPQKGIDLLLHALHGLNDAPSWFLSVVGPEHTRVPGYRSHLLKLVASLGLESRVRFEGPLYGTAKYEKYARSWVLLAPSRVEAPGFVNFEAGACSCPSVTTIETGIWDWTDGGGVLIPVSVEALRAALKQVLGWSVDERAERGRRSRRLVEERYSWQALTPRWGSVYQAVAEGRPAEL